MGRTLVALLMLLLLPGASPQEEAAAQLRTAIAARDRLSADLTRDAGRKPQAVLEFLGLLPGMRALDVLAADGYYTELMAKVVGSTGHVVALEPPQWAAAPDVKLAWAERQANGRLPNVTHQMQRLQEMKLAPASFDFALLHLVYHDSYWQSDKYDFPRMEPEAMLAELYAGMKPGGIVGVVDHVAMPGGDTREVVHRLHRIDPQVIKRDFARAGFVLDGESDALRMPGDDHTRLVFDGAIRGKTDRVVLRFRKPA